MSEDVQSRDSQDWEPRIVAFFCNWCTYTASDLAGVSRMTYAPNTRVIRVMCSGRIDPQFVLTALRQGADGVLIGGCHPGDCHYQEGNYKCLRRFTMLKRYLAAMGIEEVLTAPQSPWQNPYAERLVGSIRRELTDHVVVLDERHLRRLLGEYKAYYAGDRTHLSLGKDAPDGRLVEAAPPSTVVELPRVGGLHHRYARLAA